MHWLSYFSTQQDAILQRYEARQTLWREREQRRAEAPEIFCRMP